MGTLEKLDAQLILSLGRSMTFGETDRPGELRAEKVGLSGK